jgi:hypothetical protein
MALRPCSSCGQRVAGKLTSLYWSWNLADRSRRAYLQRLCGACFSRFVLPFWAYVAETPLLCPACHSPVEEDMDPVFCKLYVPGQPEHELELPLCPRCAADLRNHALVGAEILPDREAAVGGQAPNLTSTNVWDALGLNP